MLRAAINKVMRKENLSEEEMIVALEEIMSGEASETLVGSFLTALCIKGETIEEITGGAKVMINKAAKVNLESLYTLDTCGTGGDMAGTFNISTAAAFICAAAGVSVVKHGNRSVSSRSGSADVLEALGANIMLGPDQVEKCVKEQGIGFFFAPSFHKAMKNVVKSRKELGFRTIFNLLGPLTNPARAKTQIVGVYDKSLTEPIARVLQNLGVNHALVVHGVDGLDEITITGETKISELKDNDVSTYTICPEDFSLERGDKEEVVGGDAVENAEIIRKLFKGEVGRKRDILLLNSGAALYLGKKANSIKEGVNVAKEIIDKGLAERKLEEYISYTRRLA